MQKPPCRIVAVRTGVELRPSLEGRYPDPSWTSIVADSRGRLFTAAAGGSAASFIVWGPDGAFIATVGRSGQGPGEFDPRGGLLTLRMDRHDSLFVSEGFRWSVFSPDLAFVRSVAGVPPGDASRMHVTADNRFLITGATAAGDGNSLFHIFDEATQEVRSFGTPSDGERPGGKREVALTDSSVWVAPAPGAPDGYVLQEWSFNGELLTTIRRDAEWAAPSGDGLPFFRYLHADDEGRLWVVVLVKDRRWRELRPDEEENPTTQFDAYYEVLEPASGRLLASGFYDELPDEDERNVPPIGMVVGRTDMTYRPVPDSTGLETLEFFRPRLIAQ